MKQGQRLNLKFSIADVDFITALATAGRTAEEICGRMNARPQRMLVYVPEIQSICWQSGVKVREGSPA